MGVNATLSNFKSFTFGGTNSRSYGVYITGEGVFNAPERNVEMIDIPGRNGAYALDKGNFNNIEVTYPAGIFADNETDFATAVSDLRNLLCSKVGYVRLEDDYNPNEYRLAIYKSGLEVSHDMLIAGEFDITFECKPQRFLTSGETAVSVASGGTLNNPTLFPSRPMLEATGYGTIDIGGVEVTVANVPIGQIIVHNSEQIVGTATLTFTIDDANANAGDTITIDEIRVGPGFTDSYSGKLNGSSISASGDATSVIYYNHSGSFVNIVNIFENIQLSYGSATTLTSASTLVAVSSNIGTVTITSTMTMAYDGADSFTITITSTVPTGIVKNIGLTGGIIGTAMLDSTKSALGNPMYIDLDIGEAYKIEGGSAVSVNNSVTLPAELPTLASGSNTITYDNTFTQVKIVPRWWKV